MIVDWYGNDLRSIFRKLLMKKNSKSFCKPKFSGLSVIAFLGLIISFLCSAYGNVYKSKINAQWSKDNSHFWYRNDLPKGEREFIFVDVKKGDRRLAFDHQKLAESLASVTKTKTVSSKLPIERLSFDEKNNQIYVQVQGRTFKCELKNYNLNEID